MAAQAVSAKAGKPKLATLLPRLQARVHAPLDAPRDTAAARGYDHQWRKARLEFLRRQPLCRMCEAEGYVEVATVVDHIVPHQGSKQLFWDERNWQPLCKLHHDSHKQRQERQDGYR